MEDNKIPEPKALEEENKQVLERRELIHKITLEVEKIFTDNDLTMGELGEVMDMFNARAHSVFSQTKIKNVKHQYDRLN